MPILLKQQLVINPL